MDSFEDGSAERPRETYVDTTINNKNIFDDDEVDGDAPDMTTKDEEGQWRLRKHTDHYHG